MQALSTVCVAIEAGVNLIDTADAYGLDDTDLHHNERLVGEALRACGREADAVLVATKGGHTRLGRSWGVDGSPEYLRRACEESLVALGVEQIGLYQLHRPDPTVPFTESLGGLGELAAEGLVRFVGISNVDTGQIQTALEVLGESVLASVQNEFSPLAYGGRTQLDLCESLGLAYLEYSPLGGSVGRLQMQARRPEFSRIAAAHHVSVPQVILAWEISLSPVAIPIPGCSRPSTILDCANAVRLELDRDELDRLTRSCLAREAESRVFD